MIVPVGVATNSGPGSGYRVTVYVPDKAVTITSVSVMSKVYPEVLWVLENVNNMCADCIETAVTIRIHREEAR